MDQWVLIYRQLAVGTTGQLAKRIGKQQRKKQILYVTTLVWCFGICLFISQRPQTILGDVVTVFIYRIGTESLPQRKSF